MRWQRWLPWVVGIAIVAVIVMRLPIHKLGAAIRHGSHVKLAIVDAIVVLVTLMTDAIATWVGLIATRMRRGFVELFVVRGATYVLVLVNYAVGQGGFGYYLHRTGATPMRATGATLFLIGINLAALLMTTPIAWMCLAAPEPSAALWWTVTLGCSGFGAYLIVIALRPGFLVKRALFEPLFIAGIPGHALALVGRIPHMLICIFGQWAALRAWGIDVPIEVAAAVMPAVVVASSLPITPAGLGTSQAALIYFFADFAAGANADERATTVLAFSTVHFVYAIVASLLAGLVCIPFARRAMTPTTTNNVETTSQNE